MEHTGPWILGAFLLGLYCGTLYARSLDDRYDRSNHRLKTGRLVIGIGHGIFIGMWTLSAVIVKLCFSSVLASATSGEADSWRGCFATSSAVRLAAVAFVTAVILPIYKWILRTERRDGTAMLLPSARGKMWSFATVATLIILLYVVGSVFYRLFTL